MKGKKKLCFAASSGGHYEQILMLKPLMQKYDSVLVTERTQYRTAVDGIPNYYLSQVNRKEAGFLPKMLANSFRALWIMLKERPDVVITTGVLAVIPLCLLAAFGLHWGIVGVYALLTTEEIFRLAVSLVIFKKRSWMISL